MYRHRREGTPMSSLIELTFELESHKKNGSSMLAEKGTTVFKYIVAHILQCTLYSKYPIDLLNTVLLIQEGVVFITVSGFLGLS